MSGLELTLRLEPGSASGTYRIIVSGPGGDASGEFTKPFTDMELENFVLKVGGTRRLVRKINSPETALTREFGSRIFGALFADDAVRDVYRSSRQSAQNAGEPLRLALSMRDTPDLLQIPWEYLYDRPDYLAISRWTPMTRYIDIPKPRPALGVKLPIHILGVVSGPSDAPKLDASLERQKLVTALEPLSDMGGVTIDWLEEANLLALLRQLRERDYHVLHYIGHAGYLAGEQTGALLFEDAEGRGNPVSGEQLGTVLSDEVSLRLVVLNACEGARTSVDDPFSGVATSLIERGVPAVVAMQFEITDRAAILFASEFYTAIANGVPVEVAVAEARRGIYADDNQIEWGTPVLFTRVQDGRLFDVEAHDKIVPAERDHLLETAAYAGLDVAAEPKPPAPEPPTPEPEPEPPPAPEPVVSEPPTRAPEPVVSEPIAEPPGPTEPTLPPVTPPPAGVPDAGPPAYEPVEEPAVTQEPVVAPVTRPGWLPDWPRWVYAAAAGAFLIIVLGFLIVPGVFPPGPTASPSPTARPSPTPTPPSRVTPTPSATPVIRKFFGVVPDVYRMPYLDAEQQILDAGFTTIRIEFVCSGRLANEPNVVREVLIDVGAADGTPSDAANRLVGDDGEQLRSVLRIPLDTPLHMKVSNGSGC